MPASDESALRNRSAVRDNGKMERYASRRGRTSMSKVSSAPSATDLPSPANVVAVLQERGLIKQMTESRLPQAAAREQLTVYAGLEADHPHLPVSELVPAKLL